MRAILIGLYGDWLWLDERIETVSREIEDISRAEENCVNAMTIPGVGPMIPTAMVAAIGRGKPLRGGGTLRPGSVSCPGNTAPAGERFSDAYQSAAADICGCCLFRPPMWC